jgi:hypothetical protein
VIPSRPGDPVGAFQILISYSHDDEAQRARVLKLAERLRAADLDVGIDRMVPMPPEGWPDWMLHQLTDARGVVIAVNPGWHRRATGAEANRDLGRGVAWEWRLLRNQGYAAKGDPRLVLWASTDANRAYVPTELTHRHLHVFDPHHPNDPAFDGLVRDLKGLPEIEPRKLPTIPVHDHGFDFQWDVYLSYPHTTGLRRWVDGAFRPCLLEKLEDALGYKPRVYDPWAVNEHLWTGRRKRALKDSRILLGLWTPSTCPLVDAERRSFRERESALGITDDPTRTHLILPVRYCGQPDVTCPPRHDVSPHTAVEDYLGPTNDHIALRRTVTALANDLADYIRAAEGWYEGHPAVDPGTTAPPPIPPLGTLA